MEIKEKANKQPTNKQQIKMTKCTHMQMQFMTSPAQQKMPKNITFDRLYVRFFGENQADLGINHSQ